VVLILLLHAANALAVGLVGRRMGRNVLWLGAVAPAVTLVWTARRTPAVLGGEPLLREVAWAADLGLSLDLRLDGFALLFWWLISGIGLLVTIYGLRYFGERRDLGRFDAMLLVFAGAMLLLVSSDNVLGLFVAWELTSISSYLLIGFDDSKPVARASALQALLVTGAGGLALLAGVVLLAQAAGTYSLSGITAAVPTDTGAQVGLALILFGAFTKSAQFPFHFWLPGAMAAPTPVSAYLHSATMVKAGIYVIARFAAPYSVALDWFVPVVVAVGAASMLVGGYRALRAVDLKSLLAYGTVSQLGLLVVLFGTGDDESIHAGVTLLLAHALFKATLFLTAGIIDHQAGTRDLRRLHSLWGRLPVTAAATVVAVASMAGVFPLLGFISKEGAIESALHAGVGGGVVVATIVLGAVFTAAYGIRLVWGAFARKPADVLVADPVEPATVARPTPLFVAPAVLLTALTIVFGLWIAPVDPLVGGAAGSLHPEASGRHLALWHGLGPALYLSILALGLGVLLFRAPDTVERLHRITGRVPEATELYRRTLAGMNGLADRVSAIVQPGSLPYYAGVVLVTVLVLPGPYLVRHLELPEGLVLAESPLQVAAAALVMLAALGMTRIRRRLAVVLLLGGVGFGVAVLFVIQGAPDLALTQLLVETLSLAMFVVVLRRLPERFQPVSWRPGHTLRVVVATGVGLFFGAFSLWAASARRGSGLAEEFLARAQPEGGGRNVVNVILTDFRGFDTLGEITVLVVAAIGIAALVRPVGREVVPPEHAGREAVDRDDDRAPAERTTP
jgi:multicomponent Na+:H+ antiporter subunit A